MKIWAEHQTSSGEKVIKCPFCREDFGPAEYLREEYRNTVVPGLYRQRATEHNGTLCRVCSQSPIQGKCYRWVCGLCSYPIRSIRYIYTVEFIWIYFVISGVTESIVLRTHVDGTGLKWNVILQETAGLLANDCFSKAWMQVNSSLLQVQSL